MKTSNKLFYLALPLILLGCQQFAPGRTPSVTGPVGTDAASMAFTGAPDRARGTGAEVPPTADVTLTTTPEAKGAVISTQPVAEEARPTGFGGLVLSVKWPQAPAGRKAQLIPATANSLWVKVYSGNIGAATGSAAPDLEPVASRVVGRGMSDQIPGATPTPCCGPQGEEKSTVFLSLPPGSVTVWVGTFAEGAGEVATGSVFLSSAQKAFPITANKLTTGASLNLAGNPAIAPAVTSVSPPYMGWNGTVKIQGRNFGTDAEAVKALLYQPPACQGCGATTVLMPIQSVSDTEIVAGVPINVYGSYKIQVETGGFKTLGGTLGILDKNAGLKYTLSAVKEYYVPNEPQKWATAKGARVTVKQLVGYVQCCTDPVALPLDGVVVTAPGGATASLDASGSFTVPDLGAYGLAAAYGDAKGKETVNAFNVVASFNTNRDWANSSSTHKYLGLDLDLVTPDCESCGPTQQFTDIIAHTLYYGFKSGPYLADGANKKVVDLAIGDFTVTGHEDLVVDPGTQLVSPTVDAQPGTRTLTASLDMNPALKFDTAITVLPPGGIALKYQHGDPGGYYVTGSYQMAAKVRYQDDAASKTFAVGRPGDFNWSIAAMTDGASGSVDENGVFKPLAAGTVEIHAELKKRPTLKQTLQVTVQ